MGDAIEREPEHYPLFDWLRIALAVGVFVAHADDGAFLPDKAGHACVTVFFALSGFLIGGILIRSSAQQLPRFYFNRCLRIWVPYFLALSILLVGTVLRQPLNDPKLWEIVFYKVTFVYAPFGLRQIDTMREHMPLGGTGNHFWSICLEEQFYVVAPFVLVYLRRWRVPLLIAVVASSFLYKPSFAPISLGVLLALSRARFGAWYLRRPAQLGLVVLVAGFSLLCWWWPRFYETWIGFPGVGIVALAARPGQPSTLSLTLGGMSYPFYLNSWIGLFLRKTVARHVPGGMLVATVVAFIVALTFAFLHYRLIDRPLHRLRGRWYTPRRGEMARATAIALVVIGFGVGIALRS